MRFSLSTHIDRQGTDISVTVCFFEGVCTVTDFSAEDKAAGQIFLCGSSASEAGNLPFL